MGRKIHPQGSVKMLGEDLRPGDFFTVDLGDDCFHPGTYFVISVNPTPRYNSMGTLTYYVNMMWIYRPGQRLRFGEMVVPANKIILECVRHFDVILSG